MKCDELKYEKLGDMMPFYPPSTLVIRKQLVDAAIAEFKAKLESVQATAYTESVDAGMEIRRLKRALYKACANWAHEKDGRYYLKYVCISDDARIQNERWRRMERKCRAKAEAYK